RRAAAVALLTLALLVSLYPFAPVRNPGRLELTVLDVGQGDSLFLVSPEGRTMLIDAGGAFRPFPGGDESSEPVGAMAPGEDAVPPFLWSRGFQHLDLVVLTHAHQDHLGGLTAILQNFSVGQLWLSRAVDSPALLRIEALARERRVPIHFAAS